MKKLRFFTFSLCVSFVMGAGASPCGKSFKSEIQGGNEPTHLTEGPSSTTFPSRIRSSSLVERPPEEAGDMTNLERDAVGGAVAGLTVDVVTGEEISPASIVTDAAVGVGTGVVIRTIAPDFAKGTDAVLGVGTGVVIRTIAPDFAKGTDAVLGVGTGVVIRTIAPDFVKGTDAVLF